MKRAMELLILPLAQDGINLALNDSQNNNLPPEDYINYLSKEIDNRWGWQEGFDLSEGQIEQLKIMKYQVIIYAYMSILLNSIVDGGNYISIACNESDDKVSVEQLGLFVKNKNIAIYANSNKTSLDKFAQFNNPDDPKIDPKTKKQKTDPKTGEKLYNPYPGFDNLGAFFRVPLSSTNTDKSGWFKCQISDEGIINSFVTGKDIILNNLQQNNQSFEFVNFGTYTQKQIDNILLYYSIKYKKKATELWGKEYYEAWEKTIQKK